MSNSTISPKVKTAMMVLSYSTILANKGYASYVDMSLPRECVMTCVTMILNAIDWHEFETPNDEIEYWNNVKS